MTITDGWPDGPLASRPVMIITMYESFYIVDGKSAMYDCDGGQTPNAIVNCPATFSNNTPYAVFWAIWCAYFAILLLYHLYWCMQFPVTDFRYYITLAKCGDNYYHKGYIFVGIALTIVSFMYALFRKLDGDDTNRPSYSVYSSMVLFVFNTLLLRQFLVVGADKLSDITMKEDFPHAIPLSRLPFDRHYSFFNMYGALVSVDHMFNLLTRIIMMRHISHSCGSMEGIDEIEKALLLLYDMHHTTYRFDEKTERQSLLSAAEYNMSPSSS